MLADCWMQIVAMIALALILAWGFAPLGPMSEPEQD